MATKSIWTPEEEKLLRTVITMYAASKKPAEIIRLAAEQLPGRSFKSIQSKYYRIVDTVKPVEVPKTIDWNTENVQTAEELLNGAPKKECWLKRLWNWLLRR